MTISELSVKRKVAMCAFIIMLLFLGIKMYRNIGVDSLPKFDVPYVQITTIYPGASPEEVAVDVAKKIESAVASLDGLKHTTNICMESGCSTTLEFNLGISADDMLHEVREKLNAIADDFPTGVETPTLSKININAIPVVTLCLTGDKSIDELYDYAYDTLADRFSNIQGVGEVRVRGGNEVQLHIIIDQKRLAQSNLTIAQIKERISSANLKLPLGSIKQDNTEMNLTFDAEYRDIQALKDLEISSTIGERIYLGDIAEISLKSKELRQESLYNNQPAIKIDIVKKSDANVVKVIDEVKKRYDQIEAQNTLPSGMKLNWFRDSGAFIHASVNDAWLSVMIGIGLTAIILFLFLHDLRSTFIAIITMPIAIVIAFIAMNMLGYTFNMMTLVALGCATGVLVDNAVMVLENIFKHIEQGSSVKDSAVKGTDEVVNPVTASALTNVVVFTPVALMTSVVGLLISPFAGVMVIATLASLFISFTLTPILAERFLGDKDKKPNRFFAKIFAIWDSWYNVVEQGFFKSIDWTKRHYILTLVLGFSLAILMACWAIPGISMGFIPINDKSEISISLEYPVNSTLSENSRRTKEIMAKISQRADVQASTATMGYINVMPGQVPEGVYLTEINLLLIAKENRQSVFAVADELRELLSIEQNLKYTVNIPNPTGASGAEVCAYITGPDYEVLKREGLRAAEILQTSGIAGDIDTSLRPNKMRTNIVPNRSVLRNQQLPEAVLGTTLMGFFDGVEAGTYKLGTRTYDIRIKTNEVEDFSEVQSLVINSQDGYPLNLDSYTEFESDPVMIALIRQNKEGSVWLYCNTANGSTMGDVINLLKNEVGKELPQGYSLVLSGAAEMMEEGSADFADVFIIAIVMIYLLIAAIMESWTHPIFIMSTIPLGFIGMIFTLSATGEAMSMVSMLGGVMMIGIVVNNGILIMDGTKRLVESGVQPSVAMLQASKEKFRPVLMTSLTSIVGLLPMAFGTGLGSELRSNCGIGVVGGLTFAAITTIYLIPALYFTFVRDKKG